MLTTGGHRGPVAGVSRWFLKNFRWHYHHMKAVYCQRGAVIGRQLSVRGGDVEGLPRVQIEGVAFVDAVAGDPDDLIAGAD